MNEGVVKMVENIGEDEGIRSLKFSNRKNENVLLHDNDLVTGENNDEEDDEEDSEEMWDEDELQEKISDMKSDHVVMNENEDVQDEDKSYELVEGDDEFGEVVPSGKNDEVADDDISAPRTTRSGKTYVQVVERGIENSIRYGSG